MRTRQWQQRGGGVAVAVPNDPAAVAMPTGQVSAVKAPLTGGLKVVYLLWVIVLFDPQWWIAYSVTEIILKVPTFIFVILAMMILSRSPKNVWFPAFRLWLLFAVFTLPI